MTHHPGVYLPLRALFLVYNMGTYEGEPRSNANTSVISSCLQYGNIRG